VWQEVRKHRKDMTQEEIGEQELCVWLQLNPNAAGSQKASKIIEEANNPNSHEADAEKIRALMKGLVKTEKRLLGIIKMIDADNSSKLSEAEFYKLCKKVLKKQKKINASPGLLSAVWQEVRKHCKDMTQEEIGEHELSVWLELK
jgi:Ca2+-binding EF-hand superfamily protein